MWQPIETAPMDRTFLAVLNCAGEQTICTMRWAVAEAKNSRPDHYDFHVERVTHWMPLPDLPGAQPAPSVPEDVMRDDARRYLWLRNAALDWYVGPEYATYNDVVCSGEYCNYAGRGVALDSAIDALLAAAPEAKP